MKFLTTLTTGEVYVSLTVGAGILLSIAVTVYVWLSERKRNRGR